MKSNNKGFTLIESIVTVAIIAILLSVVGLAFTSIIHYMSESALIKNTSNEIFEQIQNDESATENESTMTFKDGLSVPGKMKTITKKYNDKDQISLSTFHIGEVQRNYSESANFYILKNPTDKNKDNINLDSDTWCVNDANKMTPNKNSVLSGTQSSKEMNYISSHVKLPDKNNEMVKINIDSLLNNEYYTGVNFEDIEIIWYRVDKNDNSIYDVYGYVEPYNINNGTAKDVKITFIREDASGMSNMTFTYNYLQNGFTEQMIYNIKLHFGFYSTGTDLSDLYYLQCDQLFNGRPFEFGRIKGYTIFNYLNEGDQIIINIIPRATE